MAESSVALATESARMRELAQRAATVAPSREPILIRGEAGVGKTHLARYIHARSSRRADVYVEITDREGVSDMTTYLFGEEPHTTAVGPVAAHPGLLQRAARGTVVIDAEVLTETERAAVSAALSDGEFSKVGGQDRIPLAARIIICERHAGSAWPIGVVLEIPPLRSRPEDYGILALQLVRNVGDGRARTIGAEVATILSSYAWPANVRELRAVLMRAALLASSTQVSAEDVRRVLGAGSVMGDGASEHTAPGTGPLAAVSTVNSAAGLTSGAGHALTPGTMRGAALADLERAHIETMLIQSNWHQGRAAQALGISTKTLYRKMREYGFIRPRKRKFTRAAAEESTLEPGRVFSSPLASGPAGVVSGALASSGAGDRHSE
jgi:two-component system NtrC family response regulator